MNTRLPDGGTRRAHLQAEARGMLGKTDPLLHAVRVPALATELWQAFRTLCASRPVGMGTGLVPQSEIQAWQAN